MDIHALLKDMTLQEKAGQIMQLNSRLFGENEQDVITGPAAWLNISLEDIVMSGTTLNFIGASTMKRIQKKAMAGQPHHIPMLFMQDVIHGYATIFPIPLAVGCSFEPEIAKTCARISAKEAAVSGVHVTFSPMVDLVRDARWGRVMESTGEDPLLNSHMAAAFVEGYQGDMTDKYNIACCIKHFAAYGAAEAGRDYNAVDISENSLRQYYLPAYKAGVDAGAKLIMTSFNTLGGVPATADKYLFRDILRDEWGYDGIVITDSGAVRELEKHGICATEKEMAEKALAVGVDIEMSSATIYHTLQELLDEGKVTMEQIDATVLRILQLKEDMGLFDNPFRLADEEAEKTVHLCPEHRELARKAAEQTAVLMKNDGVLPLSKSLKSLALIGPFAAEKGIRGSWAMNGRDEDCVSIEEGMRAALPNADIVVEKGCTWGLGDDDLSGIDAAVEAAKNAEAVLLCLGEYQDQSGESQSRTNLDLSPAQMALAKAVCEANPNTAVVLFAGRPLVLTDLVKVAPSILNVWQPGTEGGNAIANLVFGDVNPSGKLTMSFPWCTGQVPIYYNHLPTGRSNPRPKEFTGKPYTYMTGYLDAPVDPLFGFGHGLSYTTFEYGPMSLSSDTMTDDGTLEVTFTLTNTGDRFGQETALLFIHDKFASVSRPVKQLIDYKKVALEPGESKKITFAVTEEQLRFYDINNVFCSEAGEFEVMVGADVDHVETKTFTLVK